MNKMIRLAMDSLTLQGQIIKAVVNTKREDQLFKWKAHLIVNILTKILFKIHHNVEMRWAKDLKTAGQQ